MTTTNHAEPAACHEPADVNRHVHQLLARHKSIAAIWCIDDVKGIRPHLTDDQAWEVLEEVGRKHDAEYGISWTTLAVMANYLFSDRTTTGRQP